MDASYITPFIKSIQNVFSTMLQLPVTIGKPHLKEGASPTHDVSGIIGMSGDVVGVIALSFPEDTASAVVSLFVGEQIDSTSPDFADAVGELVNMVCGGAKAEFKSSDVRISVPSVICGKDHVLSKQSGVPCVCIPCQTDCGSLVIEIAIRLAESTSAGAGAASAAAGR